MRFIVCSSNYQSSIARGVQGGWKRGQRRQRWGFNTIETRDWGEKERQTRRESERQMGEEVRGEDEVIEVGTKQL